MIVRRLAMAGLLGGAAAGPYVASQAPDAWENAWGPSSNPPAQEQAFDPMAAVGAPPDLSAPGGPGSPIYASPAPLAGPVGLPLEQALDWSVTRNWVYRHWARKSTGLADPNLFGVRVPLVTGAGMTDVAGSLSYYFDRDGVLQRIRLSGRTADTSRIVHLAASRFGMQPRQPHSAGDQLLQAVEGGKLRGELRTRPEGTLWATSPHTSFDVRFEATRPGGEYTVEPETLKLDIPPAPPRVASNAGAGSPGNDAAIDPRTGTPFLPPRSLVPDRPPVSAQQVSSSAPPASRAATGATQAEIGGPPTPTLPKLGAPTSAPRPAMEPLDGYRQRFRWPG